MKKIRKKNKIHALTFSATLFLLLCLSACGSKKIVATTPIIGNKAQTSVLAEVQKTQLAFNTFSAKGSIELGQSGLSANTLLRIVKGKGFSLSMRILGIEVAKIAVSNDSLLVMDRWHKRYLKESLANLKKSKQIDFNYNNLESLLTNRLFLPGKNEVAETDYPLFALNEAVGNYVASTHDNNQLNYNFSIDGNSHIVSTVITSNQKPYSLQCRYDKFVAEGILVYPSELYFKIGMAEKVINAKLSYSGVELDKNFEIDYTAPANYQKVGLDEVLSILSGKL